MEQADTESIYCLNCNDGNVRGVESGWKCHTCFSNFGSGQFYVGKSLRGFQVGRRPGHPFKANPVPRPKKKPKRESKGMPTGQLVGIRRQVYERDGYRCLRCGSGERLTLDHVVPKSKGGNNTIGNLQTLCFHCNGKKGAMTVDYRTL